MHAHLTIPDSPDFRDMFRVIDRNGLTLICPSKQGDLLQVGAWENVSPWLRSAVVSADGAVRSVGFPKFWNLGQLAGDEQALSDLLGDPTVDVHFTEKMDGSLAIRSVIDGEVVFRTRGTMDGGDMGAAIRKVARDRYPVLLDSEFEPDASLLFEFVSPQFRVVIGYEQPDLILLGRADHRDLSRATYPDLARLASEHGLNLVAAHELPRDVNSLAETVRRWEGSEGIVIRVENIPAGSPHADRAVGGVWLVKLKSVDYLTRHRLRFHLTARTVREMCQAQDVRTLDDFGRALADIGGDWEMAQDARPLVETYLTTRAQAADRFRELAAQVRQAASAHPSRKDFAVNFASALPGAERGVAFMLLDGRDDRAWQQMLNRALDEAFTSAQAADDTLLAAA